MQRFIYFVFLNKIIFHKMNSSLQHIEFMKHFLTWEIYM